MTNPVVLVILGLALCFDYRLAGFVIVLVGVFTALTLR
jgi:hypothetical protein